MAAFSSYQHPAFPADSVSAIKIDEFIPNLHQFDNSLIYTQEGSSFDASAHESSCIEQQSTYNDPSVTQKQSTQSLSMAESGEQVTQNWVPLVNKRKSRNGSSSNSANSKDAKQVKSKKQKVNKEAMNDVKNDKKDKNKGSDEEPPKGYIHVRARRGQATDSHSLAERVRREKISERMRMLQALVPGCDKVTGKALMLDEIINYVQSLQNQVEFLSMKLASLDPMVYNFGLMDLHNAIMSGAEGVNDGMTLPLALMQASNSSNAMGLTSPSSSSTTSVTFPSALVDGSTNSFTYEQKSSFLPLEGAGSSYWGVDEQVRQNIINQFGFSDNLYY